MRQFFLILLFKIKRAADQTSGLEILLSDADLLSLVISKVGDDSLAVAKVAMATVHVVGSHVKGQELLTEGQQLQNLKRVAEKSETIRYRVFEVRNGGLWVSIDGILVLLWLSPSENAIFFVDKQAQDCHKYSPKG